MVWARLDDRIVLDVSGKDATAFLQNIVTCDMDDVNASGAGYGGLLTPQGKIVCDFLIAREERGYLLDVRRQAAAALTGRLQLYRLRADVDISTKPELGVFASSDAGSGDSGFQDPRLADLGRRLIAADAPADGLAAEADWHAHRIALAVPEGCIDFEFNEAFPHDAAMDCLGGIAFDKGCYVGQEVVSRMRHRGTARRRIVSVAGEADLPVPGTDLTADGKVIGRLGSNAGKIGIGLVRLDRAAAARDAGAGFMADTVGVSLSIPAWADYDWPRQADAE